MGSFEEDIGYHYVKYIFSMSRTRLTVVAAKIAVAVEDPNFHFFHWNTAIVLVVSHGMSQVSCAVVTASIVWDRAEEPDYTEASEGKQLASGCLDCNHAGGCKNLFRPFYRS